MTLLKQSLHLLIEFGDCPTVEKLLENNPSDDPYLLNDKFESAIKTAIVHKRFDIYDFLKSKKMCLGQHERMEDLTSGLSNSEKRELSSINKKYFRNANIKPKHIEILISRTQLGHDGDIENEPRFKELYCAAFENLNEIPLIENILKIASTTEKLCIVFDFHRESVEHMNPTKNKSVRGSTCVADNYIYIGARNLQDPQTRWMVLGTIAHELCHLAMKIVYNNSCKPYASRDAQREKDFQKIVESCKNSQDQENLIELAFQAYDSKKWHAELIVRVPHILAQYSENTCKISKARQHFSELFNFFEEYALNAFIREYSEFETRENVKEVNRKLNFDAEFLRSSSYDDISFSPEALNLNLEAIDKIIHVPTKFRHLTIKAMSQQIRKGNFESSYIFSNLKYLEDPSKSNLIDEVFELIPKPTIILDCNEITAAKDLIPLALKFKERVILVTNDNCKLITNHSNIEKREFELGWRDLSNECKDELLNQQVKFQGKSVTLHAIIKKTYLETLETDFLKNIIEKSDVKIGTDIVGFSSYIERKFLGNDPTDKNYSDDLIFEYDVGDINIFDFLKQQRIILLCDEPGMGKSTELKMLAVKLKTKFPNRWIVFMDLKIFFKFYEKDGSNFSHPRSSGDIIKFFCKKNFEP